MRKVLMGLANGKVRVSGLVLVILQVALLSIIISPLRAQISLAQEEKEEVWLWNVRINYTEVGKSPQGSYTSRLMAQYKLATPVATTSGTLNVHKYEGTMSFSDSGRWHFEAVVAGEMSEPEKEIKWGLAGSLPVKSVMPSGAIKVEPGGLKPAGQVKTIRLPFVLVERVGEQVLVNEGELETRFSATFANGMAVLSRGKIEHQDLNVDIGASLSKKEGTAPQSQKSKEEEEEAKTALAKEAMEQAMKAMAGEAEEEGSEMAEQQTQIAGLKLGGFKELSGKEVKGSRQWASERAEVHGYIVRVNVTHNLSWEFSLIQGQR